VKKLLTILVVSLGLAGCAGTLAPVTPETPRESLVAAEAAYEFAILEVRSLIVSGVIVPRSDLADALALVIIETRAALDAWQANPDNPNFAVAAQRALRALQLEVSRLITTQESSSEGWGGLTEGAMA
jgi:hypothetical protein